MVMPTAIGRFRVEDRIGAGAQGVVLRAHDDHLERSVAIKLLKPTDGHSQAGPLSAEARIAGRLQHPNIVTVHEVGSYHSLPYIVFEFVDGESLKALIEREKSLGLAQSVILMSQILAGVAHLHAHRVVHRDLNPANILITNDGIPKVTDFGLASEFRPEETEKGDIAGTLRYMAPETLQGDGASLRSDVFSLGAILFEMLAGERMIGGVSYSEIVDNLMSTKLSLPHIDGAPVHPIVGAILHKAVQRDPAKRYESAGEMKGQLDRFRVDRGEGSETPDADHSTVQFLLRRMQHKKGFSAISAHVSEMLQITSEDSAGSANRIANILAKDITLSQRVLTMANSSFYGAGEISTLQRAIVLVGLEHIRLCVMNALLQSEFERGSPELLDALLASFFSAVTAKELARKAKFGAVADVYMGALFHTLGRTLTIHYFYEEFLTIRQALVQQPDELTASRQVLGLAYHELGAAVGKQWQFPELLIKSMRPLARGEFALTEDEDARVHFFAALGNLLTHILQSEDEAVLPRAIEDVCERSAKICRLDFEDIRNAFETAAELSVKYAQLIGRKPRDDDPCIRLFEPFPEEPEADEAPDEVMLEEASESAA